MTTDITAGVAAIEAEYKQKVVAIVLDEDGNADDYCFNWQSAQNYALNEGRQIVAINDDCTMTKAEIQSLCDAERDRYRDCYGIED